MCVDDAVRMPAIPVADEVLGDWATFDAEVYEHQGMGIYRRIA